MGQRKILSLFNPQWAETVWKIKTMGLRQISAGKRQDQEHT
jgi:hypothetical protein